MDSKLALTLPSFSKGYHLITSQVLGAVGTLPKHGLIHIFIRHTSAGLGTWQGICLCEFRRHGGPRSIVITVTGED
ncbi:MAG: hypothetical protein GXO83_12270 [Chlorobi bacterium]|nr:hypothetical protein [Chlorobiota bacterium]